MCQKFEDLISLYIDDMISPLELEDLLEHLDTCDECRSYYNDLKSSKEAFKNINIDYPEELTSKILDSIEKNKKIQLVGYKPKKLKPLYGVLVACACFALIYSASSFYMQPLPSLPEDNFEPMLMMSDETDMPVSSPMQSRGIPISINDILSDDFAFILEFMGSNEIKNHNGTIIYSDDNTICIEVENSIPVIESMISTLKNLKYQETITEHSTHIINTESDHGIFVIHKQ